MEKAELKAILWQARRLDIDKRLAWLKVTELEAIAQKCTPSYGGVAVSGGDNGSRFEQAVMRLIDYKNKCLAKMDSYREAQDNAERLINLAPDQAARQVLKARYLHSMSWASVCEYTHYSRRQCARLHGMGIMQILQAVNDGTQWHTKT